MQPHEQHDAPGPKKPDPKDGQAKWLLLAIGILLALIAGREIAGMSRL